MRFRRYVPTGFWWGNLKEKKIPARIWEGNIKVDLTETGWEDVELDSSDSGCGKGKAFVNTVMNLWIPC